MKDKFLAWIGVWFFRFGRLCLSRSQGHGRCWICSAAAGMGSIWSRNGMTCTTCDDRWEWISKEPSLLIDWRGIGRFNPDHQPEAEHQLQA